MILVLLYVLTIPAANWLIGHVGTTCVPDGPCLIPVLPGLMAPSGVLMIGAALLLRDLVQRRYGPAVSLAAIAAGVVRNEPRARRRRGCAWRRRGRPAHVDGESGVDVRRRRARNQGAARALPAP